MKRVITFLLFICIIFGMLGMPALAVNDEDLTGTTNSTEIDEILDSDGDGIPDYMEIYFGTNEHLSDSDSDGVPDYIELYITWTDPLIPNGHIDTDGDGLTNAVECSFGTNADDKDTDNDRITDYDEIFLYQTDPLTKDGDDLNADEQDAPTGRSLYMIGSGIIDPDIHEYEGGGSDPDPTYRGLLYTSYGNQQLLSEISYKFSCSWFRGSNTTYNPNIAVVSSIASSLAYDDNYIYIGDGGVLNTTASNAMLEWMTFHGMIDFEHYDFHNSNQFTYDDDHLSEMYIAHTSITVSGELESIICVVIRGTSGAAEWRSNFDVGSTTEFSTNSEWTEQSNHRGFDITANRLNELLEDYIDTHCGNSNNILWITGHSRGGALANLLAAKRVSAGDNVFCYTFASPATTTNTAAGDSAYGSIFNIINKDDIVPKLPLASWEFTRYGVDKDKISIEESYADEWDNLNNNNICYNSSITATNSTIEAFENIAENRDACYKYRVGSDGYHPVKNATVLNAQLSYYPASTDGLYCYELTTSTSLTLSPYYAYIYQKPAFFMQLLAAVMGGQLNETDFVKINFAPYLETAKGNIIYLTWFLFGDNDTEHPHYLESYYLLATKIT